MAETVPRARPLPASAAGLLVIDKPAGCTSHDVVARCRRVFGLRKVGHGGTLDPDATGVLLVGLGPATRLLRFLSGLPKSYTAEVVLGASTTTLDASGAVIGTWDMTSVTLAAARAAAATLTGTISQIPPMVSAVHVNGRRLHELARAGMEVERAPRTVKVSRFDVEHVVARGLLATPSGSGGSGPVLAVSVDCSSGTYIRALASDLGSALGGGAHVRNLRRTAVGPFTVDDAVDLDRISADAVLPLVAALPGMPTVTVSADLMTAVGHGRVMDPTELGVSGAGPWAVLDHEGQVLAVYQAHDDGRIKPALVLGTGDSGTRDSGTQDSGTRDSGTQDSGTQDPRAAGEGPRPAADLSHHR